MHARSLLIVYKNWSGNDKNNIDNSLHMFFFEKKTPNDNDAEKLIEYT